MNTLLYSLLLTPMLLATIADTPLWEKLERLTWKNRVVVVYAPVDGAKPMQQQLQSLSQQTAGVKDRDIVVVECVRPAMSSEDRNFLNRRFKHDLDKFGVWLIGKDGGIKLSSAQPVTAQKLFDLIDTMPMRRSEMKRDN
jgi:hypothetical protein